MKNLLEIQNLTVELMTNRGIVYAISGVDMSIRQGEIHGVVGESGCGKSMTAKSILRLHNKRRSRMGGSILFEDQDLLTLSNRQMERLRGSAISMIFQDPMTSLNPLMSVGIKLQRCVVSISMLGKRKPVNGQRLYLSKWA
jgi:ABC-type dipeptide/oligopeptide/nickel transport system ATPase component